MKIIPVVRKALLKDIDEEYEDMLYWLSKTPQERIAEVTRLRSHFLAPGQRLDKTMVVKKEIAPMTLDKDFEDFGTLCCLAKKINSKFGYGRSN